MSAWVSGYLGSNRRKKAEILTDPRTQIPRYPRIPGRGGGEYLTPEEINGESQNGTEKARAEVFSGPH